jgi:hypothetical protein
MILLTLFMLMPVELSAQNAPGEDAQAFAAFWTKFKAAVAQRDKEAVASMTKLPFLFESQEHSKAGFIKIYDQLIDRRVTKCLASAKPVQEGDLFEVFCGKNIFYFGKVEGEYKFLEFGTDY